MSRPRSLDFLSHSLSISLLLIVYRCSTCLKTESDCINTRRPFIHSRRSSSTVTSVADHNICFNAHILAHEKDRLLSSQILLKLCLPYKINFIRISSNTAVLLLLRISYTLLSLSRSKHLL
jgi:hypothetical protein